MPGTRRLRRVGYFAAAGNMRGVWGEISLPPMGAMVLFPRLAPRSETPEERPDGREGGDERNGPPLDRGAAVFWGPKDSDAGLRGDIPVVRALVAGGPGEGDPLWGRGLRIHRVQAMPTGRRALKFPAAPARRGHLRFFFLQKKNLDCLTGLLGI